MVAVIDRYPGAIWMPAVAGNYRKAGRAGFSKIVVHCTDGRSRARPVAEMWQELGHGSSAHFVIDQDGTVIQAVSLADIAYHAHHQNAVSVGIEHCCRTPGELGPNDPGLPPSATQIGVSAKLAAWLCRQGGFAPSPQTIQGHAQCDPDTTHADCPEGSGLLLGPYVVLAQAEYAPTRETAFI